MNVNYWILIKHRFDHLIYKALRTIIHCVYALFYRFRGRQVPPVDDPILLMPATELAKRIREQKLTSETVIQSFIKRIGIVEPYINATADCCFDEAVKEAKKADVLVASGKVSIDQLEKDLPLLGVPFTVKILLKVKGIRSTAGSLLLKDNIAREDADVVARMKRAGAIVLATTNAPELGLNIHTSNYIHGTTLNPYDTNRTSGGSSGGESALQAAAGSVIGLGNDLGGSLRMPSLFTGIFGHKPSRGLVSNEGSIPSISPKMERLVTPGPMCRYAQDLVTMMKILGASNENNTRIGEPVNFQDIKVFYMYSFGEDVPLAENVNPEIQDAIAKAVSYFRTEKKCKVQQISIPELRESFMVFLHATLSSAPNVEDVFAENGAKVNTFRELRKCLCLQSTFTYSTIVTWIAFNVPVLYSRKLVDHYKKLEHEIQRHVDSFLDVNSILILPTLPFPAPYPSGALLYTGSTCYTSIFNVLGMPATHCPIGFSTQGLPIGVQIASQVGNDHLTIASAVELEKAFGGWKCPN